MSYFIKITNNNPEGYPLVKQNLIYLYPDLDLDTQVPEGYEVFNRIIPPALKMYEKSLAHSFIKVDGIWTDLYEPVSMNETEREEKRLQVETEWLNTGYSTYPSWVLNENIGRYIPPVACPGTEEGWIWLEDKQKWTFPPAYPTDGKLYRLNHDTEDWEEIPQ